MKSFVTGLHRFPAAVAFLAICALPLAARAQDVQSPSAPAGLAATDITSTSVTLTWSASTDDVGVVAYRLYRLVAGGGSGRGGGYKTARWVLDRDSIPGPTADIAGLAPSSAHTYSVIALDAAGNQSARSASIRVVTLPPPPPFQLPPVPGTPYAVAGEPFLYRMAQVADEETSTSLIDGPAGATFDSGTGLVLWTPASGQVGSAAFVVEVKADEGTFNSRLTIPVYPFGSGLLPPAYLPEAPVASDVTTSGCTLTWLPATDPQGASGYKVIAEEDAEGGIPSIVADTGDLSATVSGLAPDTPYRLWVVDYDASGATPPNGVSPPVLVHTLPAGPVGPFVRGDATGDGKSDLTDAIQVLSYLYASAAEPGCLAAADANGSGSVDLADAIYLVWFLFQSGDPLPPPFPGCGFDPGPESPGCSDHPACP